MEANFTALILMGGKGRRLGSHLPKQFHLLGDLKVYQHTLQTFLRSRLFQEIILVCHPDWIENVRQDVASFAEVKVICGGETRQASSWEGLKACAPNCHYVMIHDAVRPFVSLEVLHRNAQAVQIHQAVDTVIPTADTLITTTNGMTIASIPSRDQFRRGQTPQTFSYPLIYEAHKKSRDTNATDDCRLVLDMDFPVHLVQGSEDNLKITTEWDLVVAEHYLRTQCINQGCKQVTLGHNESSPIFLD